MSNEFLPLREIQLSELNILLAFRDYCHSRGMHYTLCGGTLLGAIRHGGFIPWDDDVDVFVARADYENLIDAAEAGVKIGQYELISDHVEEYGRDSILLRLADKSIVTESEYAGNEEKSWLWIDILPVDGVQSDLVAWKRTCARAKRLRRLVFYAHADPNHLEVTSRATIRRIAMGFVKLSRVDKLAYRLLVRIARQHTIEESTHVACVTMGLYGSGERMPKQGFMTPTKVMFEGEEFNAMSCWDEYLTGIYGDYMTPPPAGAEHSHRLQAWRIEE